MKFLKNFLLLLILVSFLFVFRSNAVLAECSKFCEYNKSCSSLKCDTCPWCSSSTEGIHNPVINRIFGTGEGAEIIALMIANFLKVAFYLAALVLLAMLIWSAVYWLSSGGDKEKIAKAQKGITAAIVGFIIFMVVFAIIYYIAPVLGLDFLNILRIEWPTP